MGQTAVQKILARASGREQVDTGEIIWVQPDLVTIPEVSFLPYLETLRNAGITEVANPDRVQ